MSRFRRTSLVAASLLATAVACGRGGSDHTPVPDDAPRADPAPAGVAAGGADSVIAWIGEIREGIGPLAGQVGTDPEAARQRAVELYITRQERIEQTVGPGTGSAPELATSVHEAEARFHELMQLLGETPHPDSTRVAASVRALDAGLAEVLERIDAEGTTRASR